MLIVRDRILTADSPIFVFSTAPTTGEMLPRRPSSILSLCAGIHPLTHLASAAGRQELHFPARHIDAPPHLKSNKKQKTKHGQPVSSGQKTTTNNILSSAKRLRLTFTFVTVSHPLDMIVQLREHRESTSPTRSSKNMAQQKTNQSTATKQPHHPPKKRGTRCFS